MTLIIILFAVAGLLLLKYSEILGRTNGEERPQDWLKPDANGDSNVETLRPVTTQHEDILEVTDLNGSIGETLIKAKDFEPSLDMREVLKGASQAYEMVLVAFENGDKETLKTLLSESVYQDFSAAIDSRQAQGMTVEAQVSVETVPKLLAARLDPEQKRLEIDLSLEAELATAVYDAEGTKIEGDLKDYQLVSGVWSFRRILGSADPSWEIIATE